MKKKLTFLLVTLALVGLIAGATLLYGNLSEGMAPNQLVVQATATPAATATPEATAASTANVPAAEATASPLPTATAVPLPLAPDFTVYDPEGNAHRLSDFRGKPVVLNFWASWCGPCQHEMPDFNQAYIELKDQVHFLMVNMTDGFQETKAKAASFIEQKGYVFPVYYDTDGDAATTYGVYSLPTTLFIDAEGYGIAQATGAIDRETLQIGLDMIMPQ